MSSLQRILCPVDFDERSGRAVARAQDIAARHGAEVTLLHVLPLRPEAVLMPLPTAARNVDNAARAHLEELARLIRGAGVACEVSIAHGDPAFQILQAARDGAFDLVVMATHGRKGVSRVALGSVTEAVLHATPSPLLTIPPRAARDGGPFQRVVCAVDGSPSSPATLARALAMVDLGYGELTLVNVVDAFTTDAPDTARDAARKTLAALHEGSHLAPLCTVRDAVRFGDVATEVLKLAADEDAQLIVVGARSRRGAVGAMVGSCADRIVRGSSCPVLAVPSPEIPLAMPILTPVYA
jgi:nucleotide-binding universal stress UspA family protein